jgi:hypothetical protein
MVKKDKIKLLVRQSLPVLDDNGTIIDVEILRDIYILNKRKAEIEESLEYYFKD